MSEQEKKSGGNAGGSTIVMVDQSSAHHKQPYRPTELEEEAHDPHHKRTRAPAVPSVAEDLKQSEDSNASGVENRELKETDALATEKKKFGAGKKVSSNKKRDPQPESFPMAIIETERSRMVTKSVVPQKPGGASQPIPPDVATTQPTKDKHPDEDSVVEDVADLRTPEVDARHSEWSDDEEAGGLPRSDSRASRVSRAVRQLFCCGVMLEAPSEDKISTCRHYAL
ncbi:uncharacterized protein LOC126371997 [Pectinophora gossypiella]|uniref:uncharacterized protein LOC126371997 n=1 Tax=Pectinophora gossypiella TaxID=13191 RepID=UPI00214E9CE9|nr:uncharacterized protein LOC126371997 [Pectinophora gossypiella]